jgi:hypothetical protein
MRYIDFRERILLALNQHPEGLTWAELKALLDLPYRQPCYAWLGRLEAEDSLTRKPGPGRAYVWKLEQPPLERGGVQ